MRSEPVCVRHTLLAALLLFAPVFAEPLVRGEAFEQSLLGTRPLQVLAPDADAVASLLSEVYAEAGPQLGCQLLEPDAVLAFGGYIGLLQNPVLYGNVDELATKLEQLDRKLVPRGISLRLKRSWIEGRMGLQIWSLAGLSRLSRSTEPGFLPFRAQDGWAASETWRKRLQLSLLGMNEKRQGILEDNPGYMLFHSRLAGMPDCTLTPLRRPDVLNRVGLWTDIPGSDHLECLSAQFRFLPRDLDDAELVQTYRAWGNFLTAFYADPRIKNLEASPEFQAARRAVLVDRSTDPTQGWWSDERRRLGLWSEAETEKIRGLRARELTDRHERALRAALPALKEKLASAATPGELLPSVRLQAEQLGLPCELQEGTLQEWFARGVLLGQGHPAFDWTQAVVTGQPAWAARWRSEMR